MVVVIRQNRLVRQPMSSRRVCESDWDFVVEGNRLKKYWGIFIYLSNLMCKVVIKLLKFDPLCYRGHGQCKIPNSISNEGLIYQLISEHKWVSFEFCHNFDPEVRELFVQPRPLSIQLIKCIPHIVAKVILPPSILIAFVPSRQAAFVQLYFLAHRERESFIQFQLICKPGRDPITTKFFSNQILVKINKRINSMLASSVNQLLHYVQISLVVFVFARLDPCPPTQQIGYIMPRRIPLQPHLVQLTISSSEKDHYRSQASIRGRQGGTFTTTFVPWIISSLWFSS